jgi:hypothetical protein
LVDAGKLIVLDFEARMPSIGELSALPDSTEPVVYRGLRLPYHDHRDGALS